MSEGATKPILSNPRVTISVAIAILVILLLLWLFWPGGDPEPEITCPAGEALVGGECVCIGGATRDPLSNVCSCPVGQEFNEVSQLCEPLPPCPLGQERDLDGICVAVLPVCPDRQVLGPDASCVCARGFVRAPPVPEGAEPFPNICLNLDESDPYARYAVSQSSAEPDASSATIGEQRGHIRAFVRFVDNMRLGRLHRDPVNHLAPKEKFSIQGDPYRIRSTMDPASYARFDNLVSVIDSMDVAALLGRFDESEPLFDQAYQELDSAGPSFRNVLIAAIDQVLAAPVIRGEIALVRPSVTYLYANEEIENLNAVQKLMVRMGPDNTTRLQNKMREVKQALE